jgi:uncharacterized protein YjiS (DUF1127 family)
MARRKSSINQAMESDMTRSASDEGRAGTRRLSLERWETIKSQACERAGTLRGQMLRDFGGWLVARPASLLCRFRAWQTRREAVRELQRLDNRTLRDMGISRSEIEYLVAGGDAERRAPKMPAAANPPKTTRNCDVMSDRRAA